MNGKGLKSAGAAELFTGPSCMPHVVGRQCLAAQLCLWLLKGKCLVLSSMQTTTHADGLSKADPGPDPESEPTKLTSGDKEVIGNDEEAEEAERERLRREREARAQALTLEIVGDLPYAEVKPPENVLFVCKLNPVTEG